MHAEVWSDFICPWCYLGRDRTAYLEELGVTVTSQPFELHPELPAGGRPVRPGGRLAARLADIGRQCEEVGLEFVPPQHVPNSRRALETAEVVRTTAPAQYAAVEEALFRAYFVTGLDISDPDVLDDLVDDAGARSSDIRSAVESGEGAAAVDASKQAAHEHGIAGTPAWRFDSGFVLPGVQPRELFDRVVRRLAVSEASP